MKKDKTCTPIRAERFHIVLAGGCLLTGGIGGLVALSYRLLLERSEVWLSDILEYVGGNPLKTAGWFAVLASLAWLVSRLLKYEPLTAGSGVVQVKGELAGEEEQSWQRVLPVKFLGGFLCLMGGLAMGRAGPSIQMSALAGKGVAQGLRQGKNEEKLLMICGAGTGLAATFHAPFAGLLFVLEGFRRARSVTAGVLTAVSCLTASLISFAILGAKPVFYVDTVRTLPGSCYVLIILLGVVLGILAVFYSWFHRKAKEVYQNVSFLNGWKRMLVPFMCAGALSLTVPGLLGSGHGLLDRLAGGDVLIGVAALIFAGRFLFSAVCFGSGAPGGIFVPLLVLGGYLGGIFAMAGVQLFGLDAGLVNHFVLFAMAGYFAAVIRTPLTAVVLVCEMTGSPAQMIPMAVVSVTAWAVSQVCGIEPILGKK